MARVLELGSPGQEEDDADRDPVRYSELMRDLFGGSDSDPGGRAMTAGPTEEHSTAHGHELARGARERMLEGWDPTTNEWIAVASTDIRHGTLDPLWAVPM